jgi:hypothetical protein
LHNTGLVQRCFPLPRYRSLVAASATLGGDRLFPGTVVFRLTGGFQVSQDPSQRLSVGRLRSGTLRGRGSFTFRLMLSGLGRGDLLVEHRSLSLLAPLRRGKARHFGPERSRCDRQPVLVPS